MTNSEVLCEMIGCSVSYRQDDGWAQVVKDINLQIKRGEVLGLVGESGCGKSTVAMQFLGYRAPGSRLDSGKLLFEGSDLLSLNRRKLEALRGHRIGFVPQNPTTALNPSISVGKQIMEVLRRHHYVATPNAAIERTLDLLAMVGLPEPRVTSDKYPHQLSGGQQQRVCIGMALACEPSLVVMDEPTTGLDVTTQRQIINLLIDLRHRINLSLLYVTHDLALLSQIADRVGVMYAGNLVEIGSVQQLFFGSIHPYTKGLLASAPKIFQSVTAGAGGEKLRGMLERKTLPPGCSFETRCQWSVPNCATDKQNLRIISNGHQVACHRWHEIEAARRVVAPADGSFKSEEKSNVRPPILSLEDITIVYPGMGFWHGGVRPFTAVQSLQLNIGEGEILALVGESGSGKSTIARAIAGLVTPSTGIMTLQGKPLSNGIDGRSLEERRKLQFIFQNPDASLNPRKRVGEIIRRPVEILLGLSSIDAQQRVMEVLRATKLDERYADRFPDQLSGGERQRVAIARALVAEPSVLICDEILSALDVSVQSSIIELLDELRREKQVSMLFISHDLAVVRDLADQVAVLFHGELMQLGRTSHVYDAPFHPYTYSLLMAVPRPGILNQGSSKEIAKSSQAIRGAACAFAGRCPWQAGELCITREPPLQRTSEGTLIRCHLPLDDLQARSAGLSDSLRGLNKNLLPDIRRP